jgi:hypothetical protein
MICQNKHVLSKDDLIQIISTLIKKLVVSEEDSKSDELENDVTDDWMFNQLVNYFRIHSKYDLISISKDIVSRFKNEFVENKRSILAKWLVRDENIGQAMVLWVIDIDKQDSTTWIIRLSDYFYFINVIIRANESEWDEWFAKQLEDKHLKVGMKLKCQNIQWTNVPLETIMEYANPVVNAQYKECFKLSPNCYKIVDHEHPIGQCDPLLISISEFSQNRGITCNFEWVIVAKLPIFYWGRKSKYSRETFDVLREDIIGKADDELKYQTTQEKQDTNIDIYQKKAEIEQKYGYDQAQINFGLVVRDLNSGETSEKVKLMLILINKWNEEMYDDLRIGQHLICNHLYPDFYHYKKFSFPLAFKSIQASQIVVDDQKSKDIPSEVIDWYYSDLRNNGHSKAWSEELPEWNKYCFVNVTGLVIKVSVHNETTNHANLTSIRKILVITNWLTLAIIVIHEDSFFLQNQVKKGDVILMTNLTMSRDASNYNKDSDTNSKSTKENSSKEQNGNNSEDESKPKEDVIFDTLTSTNFTEIMKRTKKEPQNTDMAYLKTQLEILKNSKSSSKKFNNPKKSDISRVLAFALKKFRLKKICFSSNKSSEESSSSRIESEEK